MSDNIILKEKYEKGDISRFKHDYYIKISGEDGETEDHTLSYSSQKVINIPDNRRIEIETTIENVNVLKGKGRAALSAVGRKTRRFIPSSETGDLFPLNELQIGDKWEREMKMLLRPDLKGDQGDSIPMKIHYTLEGTEKLKGEWDCAKIKIDSSLVIDIPHKKLRQKREAKGYIYFSIDEGKMIKTTTHIRNTISSDEKITMDTHEDLTIELIDFEWN